MLGNTGWGKVAHLTSATLRQQLHLSLSSALVFELEAGTLAADVKQSICIARASARRVAPGHAVK